MPVDVTLDVMLARRRVKSKDLAAHIGITEANLSLLKQGRVKGVRFETLGRICAYLDCQPGDILRYLPEAGDETGPGRAPAADAAG
ncbi:MAG: helix-turn-helix transcriptional regulator [Sneathiellaceae bacterium]